MHHLESVSLMWSGTRTTSRMVAWSFYRLTIATLAVCAQAATAGAATAPGGAAESIKRTLQERLSGVRVLDVIPTGIAGLYEVYTSDGIVYSDARGDHVFVGNLVDTRTRRSVTSDRTDARNSIDFATLPFERAIRIVRGSGTRKLAVFADPDCPYCQKLERELAGLGDATIYIFLFPLDDLHPEARAKSRAIWCAPDRAQAWTRWMFEQVLPEQADACAGDPVAELATLAGTLGIRSTPTLFLESGRRIAGVMSQDELERAFAAPMPGSLAKSRP